MTASLIEDILLVEYSRSPHGLFETDRDHLIGDPMVFLNGEEVRVNIIEEQMVDPVLPMGSY